MRDLLLKTLDQVSVNRPSKSTLVVDKNLRKVIKKSLNPDSQEKSAVLEPLAEIPEVSDDKLGESTEIAIPGPLSELLLVSDDNSSGEITDWRFLIVMFMLWHFTSGTYGFYPVPPPT